MGIQVEFNPDLALRKFGTKGRRLEECLPRTLTEGHTYDFLKQGQRNYWIEGEIPLLETKGNQELSRPLASIKIMESTHKLDLKTGKPITVGQYYVFEVYDTKDSKIHFNGFAKIE